MCDLVEWITFLLLHSICTQIRVNKLCRRVCFSFKSNKIDCAGRPSLFDLAETALCEYTICCIA